MIKRCVIGFTALTLGMALQPAIAQEQKASVQNVAVTQEVLTDMLLDEAAKGADAGAARRII